MLLQYQIGVYLALINRAYIYSLCPPTWKVLHDLSSYYSRVNSDRIEVAKFQGGLASLLALTVPFVSDSIYIC